MAEGKKRLNKVGLTGRDGVKISGGEVFDGCADACGPALFVNMAGECTDGGAVRVLFKVSYLFFKTVRIRNIVAVMPADIGGCAEAETVMRAVTIPALGW